MTKYEVIKALRKDFDNEILPYYNRNRPKLRAQIQFKAQREKKTISLGWEEIISTSQIAYHILRTGDANGDYPYFIAEFIWNKRVCFASFFKNYEIVVFQKHCLERYAERVLKNKIAPKDVFIKYLLKKQESAFRIILPTPTHKQSVYFGLCDALFLGNYEPEFIGNEIKGNWYNTCISLNEARYTQSKILDSLQVLQSFVRELKYNPIETKKLTIDDTIRLKEDDYFRSNLIEFYIKSYQLINLHLSFNFPFTKLDTDEISSALDHINSTLTELGISTKNFTPFGKKNGIALKGEIDYKQ